MEATPASPPPETARPPARVVVVDDEVAIVRALERILEKAGMRVVAIGEPVEGLAAALEPGVDVALFDLNMPHLGGIDLLRQVKRERPEVEVLLMTAYATVPSAIEAVKAGAFDYLTKPFHTIGTPVLAVRRALERKALLDQNRSLSGALRAQAALDGIVGRGAAMQAVYRLIHSVSGTSATVLVRGESGTGKELVARAIHDRSPRRNRPFVALNCGALTETLLESELFGHVRGAFTDAAQDKVGLFEAANGGTLFLDEVGELPPATQVKLLRVLQEGEVRPVGSNKEIKVDVRVVAATHAPLEANMASGRFREDLFYRLNVVPIVLPPLRERGEDLPLLAHHFLRVQADKQRKAVRRIDPAALELLLHHRWEGNIRELQNVIERGVIFCSGEVLGVEDLPPGIGADHLAGVTTAESTAELPYAQAKDSALAAFEKRYLGAILARSGGNVSEAARLAGVDRSNFRRLLKQAGLADAERASEERGPPRRG